jgi:lipoate-protein ligase A
MFTVQDAGKAPAVAHMERDRALLSCPEPLLLFYEWQRPTITYGHFIDPEQYLDLRVVAELGFDMARRPTGGGILFHTADVVFTVCIPTGHCRYSDTVLENYRWINEAVESAVGAGSTLIRQALPRHEYSSFCMASPTIYDIVIDGKKVGGSAERKTARGYIHQASLFLSEPCWDSIERMLVDKEAVEKMRQSSSWISMDRDRLKQALAESMRQRLE